jgi:uncharacterized protein
MEYRRFGRTGLPMPVISCGGMRFQHNWDGKTDDIPDASHRNVEACVRRAFDLGITHLETARGYGCSEYQIGRFLPDIPRDSFILQTKVGPDKNVDKFVENFETSMGLLKADYLDLFAFHGINDEASLEAAKACYETADNWRKAGRIRHIGFSTHGPAEIIVKAIETDLFDYVNLHWFFIQQEKWPAIEAATKHDMGVFIISPNDKGGMLYEPPEKLTALCEPFHPMVFNGLFCLARPEVHTLSCGVSRPEDFDIHTETIENVQDAAALSEPIAERLLQEEIEVLGRDWALTWRAGLPEWHETPGEINIPVILWLRNLALAWDMTEFGKMRYNLLGNGGAWFPGNKADKLGEVDLSDSLRDAPFAAEIPALLAETHDMLKGEERKRLQED